MPTNYDITKTSTIDLESNVDNFSVSSKLTDGAGAGIYWDNRDFSKWNGYYSLIPEFKKPIDAFATWVIGLGYTTESTRTKVILEHITGAGEDTFSSVLWNLLVAKKVNGDAYAEIIEDNGILQNLKPLSPANVRTLFNLQGRINGYEVRQPDGSWQKFETDKIFHLMNDRVFDNIHGTSAGESVQWVLDAMHESLADKRRMLHYSTIRVIEVEEDNPTRLTQLKTDWADAINKGHVLLLPKGSGQVQDLVPPQTEHIEWLKFLENKLYQNLGVPKVIMGGTSENTEASAKVAVIVFDPIFLRELTELELDIWNQLGIKIKINRQPSLMDNMQTDEAKNTGQTKLQYQGSQ